MIGANYDFILKHIYENKGTLEEILKGLAHTHIDSKLSTVRFLVDLFNSSKQLQSELKEKFFTELIQEDLLQILMDIMLYKEDVEEAKKDSTAREEVIEGDEEIDQEYEVRKLALLKTRVAEILTNCFQILPSKVSSLIIR